MYKFSSVLSNQSIKKCILLLFLFLTNSLFINASPVDSISTNYKDGEFVTYCQVKVKASDSVCSSVTRDFDYQMRYNLDALFTWALKGMNLRKEKNELMEFYFKSTSYNKETTVIRGVGDVVIPNVITFPDIGIDSKLTHKRFTNGNSSFNLELVHSEGFIKKMDCTFTLIPKNKKECMFTLETRIRFGWFFDMFISKKRFQSIMEWRLKKYVHNLKDEAERRERL